MQKSAQAVVPEKSMKIDGGKGLTAGIRQTLIIRYPMIAVARKRLLATKVGWKPRIRQERLGLGI